MYVRQRAQHIRKRPLETDLKVQPIAFGVSFILNLQSQSHWFFFKGTWQKRPRELDDRLGFEKEEMTLEIDQAVRPIAFGVSFNLNLQSQSAWSPFN